MLSAPAALECTYRSAGRDSGSKLTFEGPPPGYSCCLGRSYLSCEVGVTVVPFIKQVSEYQACGMNGVGIAV